MNENLLIQIYQIETGELKTRISPKNKVDIKIETSKIKKLVNLFNLSNYNKLLLYWY